MGRSGSAGCTVLAAAVLAACGRLEQEPARVLVHRLTRPANPEGVLLNEELVFHFSGEVDRASVTRDSVRIATADGRLARGKLVVEGARVRFTPAPVLARDLSDGGYLPGTRYEVEIAGFPRPDGLRGAQGEPLAATYRWSFRTVDVGGPGGALAFEDRDPDRVRLLRFTPPPSGGAESVYELGPQDALFLKCEKPLDPAGITDDAFVLVRGGARVGLRARLVENEPNAAVRGRPAHARSAYAPEAWERDPRAALLELLPERRLETGLWYLRRAGLGDAGQPRDFGAHAVWDPTLQRVAIRVAERGRDSGRGTLHEAFLDTSLRSTVAVPGADGIAYWGDTGRVEVRLPGAAGDGADGEVELGAEEARRDVRAVRLSLPAGRTCRLSAEPGPVVLRAQGALRIAGRLERPGLRLAPLRFERGTLSRWVDSALALDPERAAREASWTLIVAGGDLWIDGQVEVSTPLVLCAGGRIRVAGSVRAGRPDQLFRLGEGGGEGLVASNVTELEIDPPERNWLKAPLRFAVLSGPIPQRGAVEEWLEAEARGSDETRGGWSGHASVRYLPELAATPERPEDLHPVDHPRLLPKAGSIQVLIELLVEPGPRWRPPFVDFVRLSWQESGAEAGGR